LLRVRIIAENRAEKRGLLAEHGLSMLVEFDEFCFLFDTGQSNILSINAKKLGVDLADVDAVVLSHGHYDHTGGVPEFCRLNKQVPVYIHPEAFHERYNALNGAPAGVNIGIQWKHEELLQGRLVTVKKPLLIHNNIALSGEIQRSISFEEQSHDFLIRNNEGYFVEDRVIDEQFVVVKALKGLYLFVGCSHPGIINCIKQAANLFPGERLVAVIGGMHLQKAAMSRVKATIQHLLELGVETVIPLHCTGMTVSCEIKRQMRDKCLLLSCGDEIVFEQ
jgi:7,8-dihydropterin-6-yl-methyl-4-(beta-D-ribofuranosyl)aminobenzene 5'-phosphate synthase